MTMALCFSCGYIKHGAICPCARCMVDSTGDTELDILFSDHYMAYTTLTQFGAVVTLINERVSDKDIRFWTFMYYVSEAHSDLLHITPPEPLAEQVMRLYGELQFPPVEVLPGIRNRDDSKSGGGEQTGSGGSAAEQAGKKWWQFWR